MFCSLVIQNFEFFAIAGSLFYDLCPPKFGQFRGGCSSEHRMRPMDFVSALRGVLSKTVPAGCVCALVPIVALRSAYMGDINQERAQ